MHHATALRVEAWLAGSEDFFCNAVLSPALQRWILLLLHLVSEVDGIKFGKMQINRCLRVEATDEARCKGGHKV